MSIQESTITSICNEVIQIFNSKELSEQEISITLAQLLIYCGVSISKKELDINNLSWEILEKEYYGNNKDNDIGLGLVLNGGAIMQALNINYSTNGDETAKQGKTNVQVSTSFKNSQENRTTTTRS